MKSSEVLILLKITRSILCRYVKKGIIIATKLDNGYYDYNINSVYNFNRKEFSKLLTDVLNHNVANIIITYKDRLSRLSFMTLNNIFKHFGTNVIIINNNNNNNNSNDNDLYEELLNIIHLFSTKSYSSRRKKLIKK